MKIKSDFETTKDQKENSKNNSFFLKILPSISFIFLLLCIVVFGTELHEYITLKKQFNSPKNAETELTVQWYNAETTSEIQSRKEKTTAFYSSTTEKNSIIQQEITSKSSSESTYYVVNANSKKIHKSSCQYVQKMKKENQKKVSEKELDSLVNQGYSFCGVCFKK